MLDRVEDINKKYFTFECIDTLDTNLCSFNGAVSLLQHVCVFKNISKKISICICKVGTNTRGSYQS